MKIATFYYSQSQQALKVAENLCSLMDSEVVMKQIIPEQQYPFPWGRKPFFEAFPESRLLLPPSGIQPIDLSDVEDADLVIIVGQSWFLSPSLPLQSFFADQRVRLFLKGRPVVFVNACRNMWLMTSRTIKQYLHDIGAQMVGHIVLQDEHQNLISAFTIVRWLVYGKKEATRWLPAAGIADQDIVDAKRFGPIIESALQEKSLPLLQKQLMDAGAIHYKPSVLFLEKNGHRMFGIWAKFVRKKGGYGDSRRQGRLTVFYYYLLFVLFIISPFGQLIYWLTYPLQNMKSNRQKDCYQL